MKPRLFALFVLLVSVSLAVTAGLWGWADLNAQRAYFHTERWKKTKNVGGWEEWNSAFLAMQKARKYNPYSVDYIIEMGQLYEWGTELMIFRSDKDRALREAKKHYQLATERRPTWPHGWAHFAYVKVLLGESDDELYLAISKVMKYGSWVRDAQRKAITISLVEWDNLPLPLQNSVQETITKWLGYNERGMRLFIIRTAVTMGRAYLIRPIISGVEYKANNEKFLNHLVSKKSGYCRNFECYNLPVERFDWRFEV